MHYYHIEIKNVLQKIKVGKTDIKNTLLLHKN